jgi:excisionase family DNA binding protein
MASISRQPNGRRIIQVVCADGKRRSIRLGKVTQHMAETVKLRVELLVAAKLTGHAIDDESARWLGRLEETMLEKLAAIGLIPPRESAPAITLANFLTEYANRRVDVKPATREVWRQIERNLLDFFGADRDIRTIDEAAAEDFKCFMLKQELAPTTVAKRLQFARQFFRAAVKRKIILSNPFADVVAKATMNSERERFITREETDRLLVACPNIDWRVIVALCRFGGLRCPSEVLMLRWTDVDWERGRFLVRSPKTEHHPGKETREAPLFPELRAILEEARAAAEGAVYVVSNDAYRAAADTPGGWRNCNLRTQFNRILKRAGLEPWPRRFHALRASRETELVREYPIHVVTAWLGNTPRIALKHYLMVTDSDFLKAIGRMADTAVQNEAQQNATSSAESRAHANRERGHTTVAALRQADATISSQPAMMTVTEVAEYLRVGRNKVLTWIATGALQAANTAVQRGGRPRYRVRKSDLDIFLDGRTKMTRPNRTRRPTRHQADKDVIEFFTPDGKRTGVLTAIRAARQMARG